jgi:hypothetical protein
MAKGLSDGVAQATCFTRHLSLTKETLVHRAGGGIVLNFITFLHQDRCRIAPSSAAVLHGALRCGQQTGSGTISDLPLRN